jgi:hypothetical protein
MTNKVVTGLLAANLDTFTHQLDRVLPVAVQQSGLAPPYTQRRLGLGRLTMSVYANLSGLELPDRAQRRPEDHRICRWRGPPSRSSQPVALGSSVPWSFPLSLSLDLRTALPSGTITATAEVIYFTIPNALNAPSHLHVLFGRQAVDVPNRAIGALIGGCKRVTC